MYHVCDFYNKYKYILRYNFAAGSFCTTKLCSRLLMVFCWNFGDQQQIRLYEPHFVEIRGDARLWLIARWKTHGQLSIRVNWTLFAIYYVPELWGEMCTARLFLQRVDPFALKFYVDSVSPSTIFVTRKLETLGYPMVNTASLCVPLFWCNTGVWRTDEHIVGWRDRRTDMP